VPRFTSTIYDRVLRTEQDCIALMRDLERRAGGGAMNEDDQAAWDQCNEALERIREQVDRVRSVADGGGNGTEGQSYAAPRRASRPHDPREQVRDQALRTVERHADVLTAEAGDRLDDLLRHQDRSGLDAQYINAVADPAYNTAFGKMLQHGPMAPLRFSPEEAAAVQTVNAAEELRTTLQVGSDGAGGFAVPFTLDPTIILTSAGSQSAIRDYARVETISSDRWKGVSSTGITAAFAPELTEASDNAPALLQPTADSEKWQAFVPFSIEIGQDWGSLQTEMARLIAEAKRDLENTVFLTGDTSASQPMGLVSGASLVVTGAATATFAIADIYTLFNALPARFQDNASAAASPTIYRFVGGGSAEPPLLPTREGPLLGRPKFEWSNMTTTTTTGQLPVLVGDFSYYLIADRIGTTIELVPHLFGAARRFPIGARGIYAYGRTAATVLSANAFRWAKVK
jgi:HK97 family phage major capsid protein